MKTIVLTFGLLAFLGSILTLLDSIFVSRSAIHAIEAILLFLTATVGFGLGSIMQRMDDAQPKAPAVDDLRNNSSW